MNPLSLFLAIAMLLSTRLSASALEVRITPMQQINAALARASELYDDLEKITDLELRLKTLIERKERIIDIEIISHLLEEKKQLEADNMLTFAGHEICEKATAQKIALGVGSAALSFAAKELIGNFTSKIDTTNLSADALRVYQQQCRDKRTDRQVSLAADAMKTSADIWLNPSSTSAKLRRIDIEIASFKRALLLDPQFKLEERVLAQFDTLPPPTRKRVIDLLLEQRTLTGAKARASQTHLEHCLSRPTTVKRLSKDLLRSILVETPADNGSLFISQSPFSRYSIATQKQLKLVLNKIILNSKSTTPVDDPTSLAKAIFLFYGEPATGKSFAAREITKLFDLPSDIINVATTKDLSEGRTTGNHEYIDATLGTIYLGFFKTDREGKNYLNPVLIIDEIDRALDGKNRNLLGFLHDFFDTNVKTWQADYFGEGYRFDISNLIIIMTSNSDLGLSKSTTTSRQFSNAMDPYAAIRDRMVLVKFDDFPQQERNHMISDYLKRHNLLDDHDETTDTSLAIATFLTTHLPHETIRQSFRRAELMAMANQSEWRQICAIDNFVDLLCSEKTVEAKNVLLNTKLFNNLCCRKVDNVETHAHEVSSFIARCYPRCTRDECKRLGLKLSGKSPGKFAELLNISKDTIKIAELEQIENDHKETWLLEYFTNSAFVAYFSRKYGEEIEDAARALTATLLQAVTLDNLASILRSAEINSEKAWPKSDEQEPVRNEGHNTFLQTLEII